MPEIEAPIPASPNFEKLKAKLRELFELDKADLDFGIYRVLRQRHSEIAEFLDKHLEKTVSEALQSHISVQRFHLEDDLKEAEKAAAAAGIAPEQSPRVMELRAKAKGDFDLVTTADEVYSHLLTFFSRYYQGGDFLGLHRSTVHGRERYMIPYNGEEVKLVWANMDQYYIKSSELLRDYTFRIRKADLATGELNLDDLPAESVVRFKLVEGDTEKDNRKPDGKTTRAFALDEEKPFEETDETLCLRFRYREHTSERSLQDKLNADTEKTLADNLPPRWKALLFATDPTHQPKDKKDTRTILQKHLRGYTAKHQFDYFIHKDLGGFLRRELDFYVKNEVMHLDDIEDTTAPKAEEYLSKIRAIRRCALPVIQMIAQLEDFQKKLWLKKKFVVETRYCLTLDRVPEALYPGICTADAQWQEWDELVALSELKPNRTPEFLKAHPHLMIDTRHFPREFTLNLLASIENLDSSLDGVCFHSENFQALQLMQERYREQVKCVYIDPPYNKGAGKDFAYKDNYKSSSWISMLADRLRAAEGLLAKNAILFGSIDDNECQNFIRTLEQNSRFMSVKLLPAITNLKGNYDAEGFVATHEYVVCAATESLTNVGELQVGEEALEDDWSEDEHGLWKLGDGLKRTGQDASRQKRPKGWFPVFIRPSNDAIYVTEDDEPLHQEDEILWPKDSDGNEVSWTWSKAKITDEPQNLLVKRPTNGISIYKKQRPALGDLPTRKAKSFLYSPEYSSTTGGAVVGALFGERLQEYTPKAVALIRDLTTLGRGNQTSGVTLDFFAGSGTTAHALINSRRSKIFADQFLLVEMGDQFESVLVSRVKKVAYSTSWSDGNPQTRNTGISLAFKIVRLESYEDTLNNLHLTRTAQQETALANATETQRDAYLLGYFLDVESDGSASLLDVGQFRDPFGYKLHIATSSAGETKETNVDLVETFNWLLGLKVKHIDTAKGFLTVTGDKRAGGRCLILWRTLSADPKADNASLEKFLTKLAVNPADTEFEFIYVNGPHTLSDPHNKVHLIEETFQRLMFDTTNFETLS